MTKYVRITSGTHAKLTFNPHSFATPTPRWTHFPYHQPLQTHIQQAGIVITQQNTY